MGSANIGLPLFPAAIGDGGNYTLVIVGQEFGGEPDDVFPYLFTNDLGQTGLNEARYTVHNALLPGGPGIDVCINGVKVVENLGPGESAVVSVTAVQGAAYAIGVPSARGLPRFAGERQLRGRHELRADRRGNHAADLHHRLRPGAVRR